MTDLSTLDIDVLVEALASHIIDAYADPSCLVLVGILSNGFPLAERLSHLIDRKMNIRLPVGKLDVSLYRDDISMRGEFITIRESDIPFGIDDKVLILVDDVLFHGRTIRAALNALLDFGRPAKIDLAVLLDRGFRQIPVFARFVGHEITTDPHDTVRVSLYEIEGEDKITLESSSPIT